MVPYSLLGILMLFSPLPFYPTVIIIHLMLIMSLKCGKIQIFGNNSNKNAFMKELRAACFGESLLH
jgi:hypothetical protein